MMGPLGDAATASLEAATAAHKKTKEEMDILAASEFDEDWSLKKRKRKIRKGISEHPRTVTGTV